MEYTVGKEYLLLTEHIGLVIVTLVKFTDFNNYVKMESENTHYTFYIRDRLVDFIGEHDVVGEL